MIINQFCEQFIYMGRKEVLEIQYGGIYKQIIYFWLLPPGVWEISIIQNQIQK